MDEAAASAATAAVAKASASVATHRQWQSVERGLGCS